ncbi:uncharacterized protein LOC114283099 [Camellia sinensis]|uniref:uncharacterized protein LOC114283099 n=1 Tax=Camellia sinensis TaxID=4442 RepID=UPI001036DE5A|nr:uncharacterized protein LOC114283099 [Camellia sinensis]
MGKLSLNLTGFNKESVPIFGNRLNLAFENLLPFTSCAGERVLSDCCSRLSPQMVEALMIFQDHMYAFMRRQNYSKNEIIQIDLDDISSGNASELSASSLR